MNKNIVYILGLFENKNNKLFRDVSKFVKETGYSCHSIEIYPKNSFGSYKLSREILRVREEINKRKPFIIIAHSLGAYLTMQSSVKYPLIFLDPSQEISKIILPNLKRNKKSYEYNDEKYKFAISPNFLKSIRKSPSVKKLTRSIKSKEVYIFGAGRGGYKIAEKYHKFIPNSQYTFLPKANHEFSRRADKQKIFNFIKDRLDVKSSRVKGVHTKSW